VRIAANRSRTVGEIATIVETVAAELDAEVRVSAREASVEVSPQLR
jgi:hypothetical protein